MRAFLLSTFLAVAAVALAAAQAPGKKKTEKAEEEKKKDRYYFLFEIGGGIGLPGGDLQEQFGNFGMAGASAYFVTRNRWVMGLSAELGFSGQLREDPLRTLRDHRGRIIGLNGSFAGATINGRLAGGAVRLGKIWQLPFLPTRPPGGLYLLGEGGYMQHRYNYTDVFRTLPAINGDFLPTYDRLTSGWGAGAILGYKYFSSKDLLNFFVEVEWLWAQTNNRRQWNPAAAQPDTQAHNDQLLSFTLGWVFPVVERRKTDELIYMY